MYLEIDLSRFSEIKDLWAQHALELEICWMLMYTSILEKLQCNMFFKRVTKGAGASSYSTVSLLLQPRWFFQVLFFNLFCIVSIVATNLHHIQFQSHLILSQINVLVPIRLKFKLSAVVIEWVNRLNLLFVGRQDIVNYWDFPSRIFRDCHKSFETKIAWHD